MNIEFQKQFIAKNELKYINEYLQFDRKIASKKFHAKCEKSLHTFLKTPQVYLTSSCTASLEVACLLAGFKTDDEVIVPSYTFSSTANAIALRGAVPVFVDVKSSTLNLNEDLVEQAITKKTKAIIAVHYAGISCNMNALKRLAKKYNLLLIEDAAQGLGASYFGKPLGTIGDFGAISFHQTKNIHCGEGGAFIFQDKDNTGIAAQIIEKGTNRLDMIKGEVAKYQWLRLGSSYVLSELQTALLAAQLEDTLEVTSKRRNIWQDYFERLNKLAVSGKLTLPSIEPGSTINGHIFYILVDKHYCRETIVRNLARNGVHAQTHYEPLHLSPAGQNFGRLSGALCVSEELSKRLLRLPLWPEMKQNDLDFVVESLETCLI